MDEIEISRQRAAWTLMWWSAAGADIPVGETPRDRFVAPGAASAHPAHTSDAAAPAFDPPSQPAPVAPPASEPPLRSGSSSLETAEALAAAANDLTALRAALERYDGCGLRRTASRLVFSDGVAGSRVMLVGEGPGGDEDRIGRPFVGRAGQLLDRMLAGVGLDRTRVYIANVVPWRPPGNRTPTPEETQACLPFIRRQIELASPEILVCLGAHAAQTLLGMKSGITRARGSWFTYEIRNGRTIPAIAMLHPAYLLRTPSQKRAAWADMRALAAALDAGPNRTKGA